jgi:hypothetical protein
VRMLARRPMIVVLLLAGLALAAVWGTAAGQDLRPWPTPPPKPAPDGEVPPRVPVMQGDTVDDPFALPAIPCTVTGNTCAFNDDYDHSCPYDVVSTARDLVYEYVCDVSVTVKLDLCSSTYDTKVIVFEDVANNVIACNDDFCAWQSQLSDVRFAAGHTYYIVIDGYSGADCGDYVLEIEEYVPCVLECPPGAVPEGEPDCHDDYNDVYNSGCGCHPDFCFAHLEPSCDPIVICGTTGVFSFGSLLYRDTDWFEIDVTESSNICLAGDAEIPMYYCIIDGRSGCEGYEVVATADVGPCAPMTDLCHFCDPGTWWLWAGPAMWDPSLACGSVYWMEITGYTNTVSPAAGTTWGRVKGLFR